ncbi:MAG: polysaccharide deacetylase family protein [Deltaproteobacteria bacterium]|nr:polysaccharide deacetylase family protein [Deltaproteobacteria bacterium]
MKKNRSAWIDPIKRTIVNTVGVALFYTASLKMIKYIRQKIFKNFRLIILMYHRVDEPTADYFNLCVPPSNFEKQMRYLKKNYRVISLKTLAQYIRSKKSLPDDCVVITFDDGYRDNHTNAYPILKKYGLPATIFLTIGYINNNELPWWDRLARIVEEGRKKIVNLDLPAEICPERIKKPLSEIFSGETAISKKKINSLASLFKEVSEDQKNLTLNYLEEKILPPMESSEMLSWTQIKEMSNNNISFGSHTFTHPILTKVDADRAKYEILISRIELERKIGKHFFCFSYPNGTEQDFNEEIIKMVEESGYVCACSAINGKNGLKNDLFSLRRIWGGDFPLHVFSLRLSI